MSVGVAGIERAPWAAVLRLEELLDSPDAVEITRAPGEGAS